MNYDNLLFIVLDACRYDVFKEANTPNINKIGDLIKVYSPAGGTQESFIVYMYGCPPFNLPDNIVDSGYWYDYRDPRCIWKYKRPGTTLLLTGNKGIYEIAQLFKDKFDILELNRFIRKGSPVSLSCRKVFSNFIQITKNVDKFHAFLWLMETHHPYSTEKHLPYNHIMKPEIWRGNQRKAVEYIDKQFEKVYNYLKDREDNTLVILLADHGDMMGEFVDGEQRWHHSLLNPDMRVRFHKKMFEIPYVQGVV